MTLLPVPEACAVCRSALRSTPMQAAFTNGFPAYDGSKITSPPMLGSPREFPYPDTPATTPGTTRCESAASAGPNRNWSITATGRAPIARMSRTIPPTPVAAPWYGSTYEGWLCDSILKVTAQPSPMSITPAFSPIPASIFERICSVVVAGKYARCTLDDLYEQCSDHITEYIASSASVGRRP